MHFERIILLRHAACGLARLAALALVLVCMRTLADDPHGGHHPAGGPNNTFHTEVPAHPYSLVLGRPTDTSVTLSVLTTKELEGFVRYGLEAGPCTNVTAAFHLAAGTPTNVVIGGLAANTGYHYQFLSRAADAMIFIQDAENTFHTARPAGAPFVFTVTADSHLDENTDPTIYAATLRNALADRPDFHIDLGDTFMTDKRGSRPADAWPQYLAQHYDVGLLCRSAPLYLVLGNHDGECGQGQAEATRMRTACFPNPTPDAFYSGDATGNSYAWQWGDALFVVLDPFRYSAAPGRGAKPGGWSFTLGRPQYDWLQATLAHATAPFKFVFIHHLVGGLASQGRGGAEAVPYFEWGGRDLDGREAFAERRPGWGLPIHALLATNGVTAVFHGHDHFYARQEVDGMVYQTVPQPGHPGDGSISQAANYGYLNGDMLPGSGYLRVSVAGDRATVDYVRTRDATAPSTGPTGSVSSRYALVSRPRH